VRRVTGVGPLTRSDRLSRFGGRIGLFVFRLIDQRIIIVRIAGPVGHALIVARKPPIGNVCIWNILSGSWAFLPGECLTLITSALGRASGMPRGR
jgi:hypothetical protein